MPDMMPGCVRHGLSLVSRITQREMEKCFNSGEEQEEQEENTKCIKLRKYANK